MRAAWWMPRADVGGRSAVMYCAASRARSALIAFRSISVMGGLRCNTLTFGLTPRPIPRGDRPRHGRQATGLQDPELDGDVAAGRPGVRADLVGRLGELADLVPFHPRDVDDQRHGQAEDVAVRADVDLGGHRGVAEVGALAVRDVAQRAMEAGAV